MGQFRVLVVDDEEQMRNLIRFYLIKEGMEVFEAKNGLEALEIFGKMKVDLVILDVMMPKMDGWEACKAIREKSNVPILMLTARTELKDKVYGFGQGADDYLTKPFAVEELMVRVQALMRRVSATPKESSEGEIKIQDAILHSGSRELEILGQTVATTKKEFDLLLLLAKNKDRVYSRESLLQIVWGEDFMGEERTVDQHVKNIREKFRAHGSSYNPIQTVWGLGYKQKEGEPSA